MTDKIGRNDLCPCGSGMKYKKCCLTKQKESASRGEESTAVPRALDWLAERYPEEVAEALDSDFYAVLDDDEMATLSELSPDFQQMVFINAHEWLINDGHLKVKGEEKGVMDLLLGPGGALLTAAGRSWLERLGEYPLSLYEVRAGKEGEGLELADLARPDQPPVWVTERSASRMAVKNDIIGTRLVRRAGGLVLSGALYPFVREEGLACRDEIMDKLNKPGWSDDDFREIVSSVIIAHWLSSLVKERALPTLVDS